MPLADVKKSSGIAGVPIDGELIKEK